MKGQVSILAIIGVLVILAGIGVFIIMERSAPASAAGFADLELALEQCVATEVDDLLPLAALHGGELAYTIDAPIGTPRIVRDDQNRNVPVWVSFGSGIDALSYTRPKLHERDATGGGIDLSIEEQVSLVLSDRLKRCIEEEAIKLDVDAIVRDVESNVIIGDTIRSDVSVEGSFSRDGRSASRLSARSETDSSFLELFETAQAISVLEAQSGLFGAYIQDIIALDSGVDATYPPIYAYDFSYAPRIWTAQGVSTSLDSDLARQAPFITLSSSQVLNGYSADYPYVLRRGLIDLERRGEPIGDRVFLSVTPTRSEVRLNNGMIVSGEPINSVIPLVGDLIPVRQYRTSYDVEAPLIVSLISRVDGLVFRFAIKPRIENNNVMRSGSASFAPALSEPIVEASRAYCDSPVGATALLTLKGADRTGASVTYTCGTKSCTYPFSEQLTLPACIGGELKANAPGVRFASEHVDSNPETVVSNVFNARPEVDVGISVTMRELKGVLGEPNELEDMGLTRNPPWDSERVIITFNSLEFDHTTAAVVTGSSVVVPQLYESLYEVSLIAIRELEDGRPVVIPEGSVCAGLPLGSFCIGNKEEIPEVAFEDSLVLATHEIGNVYIPNDGTLEMTIPIFNLGRIPEDERKHDHVVFFELISQSETWEDFGEVTFT